MTRDIAVLLLHDADQKLLLDFVKALGDNPLVDNAVLGNGNDLVQELIDKGLLKEVTA